MITVFLLACSVTLGKCQTVTLATVSTPQQCYLAAQEEAAKWFERNAAGQWQIRQLRCVRGQEA